MSTEDSIKENYLRIKPILNERQKRLWAASEAISLGYGGVSILQKATNLSRSTIHIGIKELHKGLSEEEIDHIRQKGGGRKSIEEEYPRLLSKLKQIIEPVTSGDPMKSTLLWTSKSTRHIAQALKTMGFNVSHMTVSQILEYELGYSLQRNRRALAGVHSLVRDEQFRYINDMVKKFQEKNEPVVSVDAKKKELVGNFANAGQEWCPHGKPRDVNVHDFESGKKTKKAIPGLVRFFVQNLGHSTGINFVIFFTPIN
jgi:hypothetical protein